MKVEIKGFKNQIKAGDVLSTKINNEVCYYLITSYKSEVDDNLYILRNLDGNHVWDSDGNSKLDILYLIEVGKFTHYPQDEFKLALTKIQS